MKAMRDHIGISGPSERLADPHQRFDDDGDHGGLHSNEDGIDGGRNRRWAPDCALHVKILSPMIATKPGRDEQSPGDQTARVR